jgi:hypothetical protein
MLIFISLAQPLSRCLSLSHSQGQHAVKMSPSQFSPNIVFQALQALEKLKYVEKSAEG